MLLFVAVPTIFEIKGSTSTFSGTSAGHAFSQHKVADERTEQQQLPLSHLILPILGLSFCSTCSLLLWISSLAYTSTVRASIFESTSPIHMLLYFRFVGERISPGEFSGSLIAFAGILISFYSSASFSDSLNPDYMWIGDGMALLTGVLLTAEILVASTLRKVRFSCRKVIFLSLHFRRFRCSLSRLSFQSASQYTLQLFPSSSKAPIWMLLQMVFLAAFSHRASLSCLFLVSALTLLVSSVSILLSKRFPRSPSQLPRFTQR